MCWGGGGNLLVSICYYVCRTRDPKVLEQCDVVVDVGGVYDPDTHRYDHHQRLV